MHNNIGCSRNILLINSKLAYKRRYDLEDARICTVWTEIFVSKRKSFLCMGGYRQWSVPSKLNIPNSKHVSCQKERFQLLVNNWERALKEKKDTIVMMDTNIDTRCNTSHNAQYKIKDLFDMLFAHLNKYGICIHNKKFTRYRAHQQPSCIDHIFSNCPVKIIDVKTTLTGMSDHCILSAKYTFNGKPYEPSYRISRNFQALTKSALELAIDNSECLNSIFNYDDPDIIAEILQTELNLIIEVIAPHKVIQCKKDYIPYLNDDLKQQIKENNDILSQAINTNNSDSWRHFRNKRAIINKNMGKAKTQYIQNRFRHSKDKWRLLKSLNNSQKQQIPHVISHKGDKITSPKEIAKIANDHYIDKIQDIRKKLEVDENDPIELLNSLIPKNLNSFSIPFITVKQTSDLIKKAKNSNSTGYDSISNNILKKIEYKIAPFIAHLINCIILHSRFPSIYKLTKILPISKPGKPLDNIDSYRPINNLPCIEKLIEEYMKSCLISFLDQNNIIHKNHHGGRAFHSPITAQAHIHNEMLMNYENDKTTAILTTDLSSCYDTIDHRILLRKLEHYGVRDNELKLFESYLSERYQYVEIETFKSEIKKCNDYSVIQGSKLSGLLYNIYTNELPLLNRHMHSNWFNKITGQLKQTFKDVDHKTIIFVDDSSSIISFKNHSIMSQYLQSYFSLIYKFYNLNKLKINSDKTCLLIVNKPKLNQTLNNFSFKANQFTIKRSKHMKILGFYISENLSLDYEINNLTSSLHYRIQEISKIHRYTDFKTRLAFMNSIVISKLNYMLPMYMTCNKNNVTTLHNTLMKAARTAIGSYCYKKVFILF